MWVNVLATIIYFIVFIEAFIALSIYIGGVVYRFFKAERKSKKGMN